MVEGGDVPDAGGALLAVSVWVPDELGPRALEVLFEAGAGGVEEREVPSGVEYVAYGDRDAAERLLQAIRAELGDDSGVITDVSVVSTEWRTAWSASLSPVQLTDDLVLCPGDDAEVPPDLAGTVLRLEIGLSFGYGDHVTTRLAASAVQAFCRRRPGASVLDVGCGTGVLGIVAALSGAGRVLGVDTDATSVAVARRNAIRNSVATCDFSGLELTAVTGPFDLVVANIDLRTLVELARYLKTLLADSGSLIMTGFLVEDADEVAAAYGDLAFFVRQRRDEDGYALLELLQRSTADPA